MKIIVTITPTNLVTNSLFYPFLSFRISQKQERKFQQVGGMATKSISAFCL